jgi:hexosaminidase
LVIEDVPSVAWRGLMVDVARHYLPLPLLVATLDAMRAVKLNVLHLHLTDAQSFPLLLQDSAPGAAAGDAAGAAAAPGAFSAAGSLFPTHGHDPGHDPGPHDVSVSVKELGRLGAFPQLPPRSRRPGGAPVDEGMVYGYTAADLAALVREASLRGIRVVPEVDVPAHTLSWGEAYPDMVVACAHQTAAAQSPSDVPALDPSHELTYRVVFAVLEAVAKVFPDEYLHLGADEVSLWVVAAAVVGLGLGRVRSAGPVAWPPRPIPHGCAAAALFVARAWACACGPRCGCRAGKRTQPSWRGPEPKA